MDMNTEELKEKAALVEMLEEILYADDGAYTLGESLHERIRAQIAAIKDSIGLT